MASITPGTQAFRRLQVSSPYVDGTFTTQRSRDIRSLQIAIDTLAGAGGTDASLITNLQALIAAFEQDYFELYWYVNDAQTRWAGEAADRQNDYTQERVRGRVVQIVFTVPVQPILLAGAQ